MTAYSKQHTKTLDAIVSALPAKTPEIAKRFTWQFYAKIPSSELLQLEKKQAALLAMSAYEFFSVRKMAAPKLRIFTPNKKEYGYDAKHVVIEVINNDMPFLVDSLTAELARHGLIIRETIHPIFKVQRDKNGSLMALGDSEKFAESFIHFEISALPENIPAQKLQSDVLWVLDHIRAVVSDWLPITQKIDENILHLQSICGAFDKQEVAEVEDFLRWLAARNFVFMGYAEYDFFDAAGKEKLSVVSGSKLGVLKIEDEIAPRGLESLPPELRHFLLVPQWIEITKSNRRSQVHRPVLMDYIGIKRFDTKGKVIGEARFLGLFTSNVYYQSSEHIPLVRRKVARILERSDFDPASHDGKALKAILEFLPRDEIFQMSDDDLFETSMGILALEAKPRVRIFVRKDAFERFVSAMIFVPRERFSTDLRHQIQKIVEKAFNGSTSSFSTQITEAPLARLHLTVKTTPREIPNVDMAKIEHDIAKRAYLWGDLLFDALTQRHGAVKAESTHYTFASAFPQSYINRYDSAAAVHDIDKIEQAQKSKSLSLELFQLKEEDAGFVHLKIYNPNEEIALSDILPMLENAGFKAIEEHPFIVTPYNDSSPVWIRDIKLKIAGDKSIDIAPVKSQIEEMLLHVWRANVENDRLNALVLKAGLSWSEVQLLRAYSKYLRQIGFSYSQSAIEQAMNQHAPISRLIAELFLTRFLPDLKDRSGKQKVLQEKIESQLMQVSNVAEDRILRRFVDVVMATLRTNYFQTSSDGNAKSVLSFKFDCKQVPELPLPKPFAEIFVYSTRVEGIHLRGGKVARGGLRWSDRHEDFRTEVLGLMKAQMVKNSVIVPVGSKGGFVVKRPPASGAREAVMEEGISCYTMYLQGLLDITDNIISGKVVPPVRVVRHDEDDPYLVVAADKGTATFSDIANGVSKQYGFWLGDAFASGGSVGYDHKKMAITARGGWVSVERHFAEMGVDISKEHFTVAGIGDMAGDVFGNGMLLSKHIKLLAAFNHQHIFIDPAPDAPASFKERGRLFDLPRSSWKDYNEKIISSGGGIYERSAKSITLSKEAQQILGVSKATLSPDEVIRAILLAPVDLLWNGGIGTYVKAIDEVHEQVGDRANNSVRVNGQELRCKVVGEGGNLGFTQKGRIEYARSGGRINTDAIDNSAGVDCSDHEVNIKIALSHVVSKGDLTLGKRDKLLTSMTEDVAALVLKDNILQTQAITIAHQQGVALLESQARLIHTLERSGALDRAIEFLPTDKQISDLKTAGKGLTRPEIAVLLAYSKMVLYKELLDSTLPDEPYFTADLMRYFPKAMQQHYAAAIEKHPLKREIIATVVTNSMVNRAGMNFFFAIAEDMGVGARDIAASYTLARDAFGLRAMWKDIESAADISTQTKVEMYVELGEFLERMSTWLLRHLPLPLDINMAVSEIAPGIAELEAQGLALHSHTTRKAYDKIFNTLRQKSVPMKLAEKIANLEMMSSAFDIIAVAHKTGQSVASVGKVYFEIGANLRLGWLRLCATRIATHSHWERLATQSLIGDFYDEQRRLTMVVLEGSKTLDSWHKHNGEELKRYNQFIADLKSNEFSDIPRLMVALRHVRSL
jgi:glutamate dehydrogenase